MARIKYKQTVSRRKRRNTTYADQNSRGNHVCYDENEHIFDSHQLSFSLYPVRTALITARLQNTIYVVSASGYKERRKDKRKKQSIPTHCLSMYLNPWSHSQ